MGARLLWGIRECSEAGQRRWLHTSEHAKATDTHSGMREPQGAGIQFNKAAGGGPAAPSAAASPTKLQDTGGCRAGVHGGWDPSFHGKGP